MDFGFSKLSDLSPQHSALSTERRSHAGAIGRTRRFVYVPLSDEDRNLTAPDLARKYRIDPAKAYEAKGRGTWVQAAPQLNPFRLPFVATKGESELSMTEHDDRPAEYRLIAVMGEIAKLDAMAERHWEEIAPKSAAAPDDVLPRLEHIVANFERTHIVEALTRTGWNKSKAARLLGTTPRIIHWKMKQLGIIAPGLPAPAPAIALEREE